MEKKNRFVVLVRVSAVASAGDQQRNLGKSGASDWLRQGSSQGRGDVWMRATIQGTDPSDLAEDGSCDENDKADTGGHGSYRQSDFESSL